jgi:hypothetical protein
VSVRLEQLLAAATPGTWRVNRKLGKANYLPIVADERRLVVMPRAEDAALIAKTPDMARLLIDMGEALRLFLDFFEEETMHTHSPSAMCQKAEALAARLDALGKDTA